MSESVKGLLALILACTIWGLSPLYYKLLVAVPPLELLAHRILWSAVFFFLLLIAQRKVATLRGALTSRQSLRMIVFAATIITVNWFLFIVAIQINRATEASLGYYIFPLVAVLLGMVLLKERHGPWQMFAVGLAALAVVVLTLGQGVTPWISLVLATSFGIYGIIKKQLDIGPVVSVTAEALVLTPLALAWLAWVHLSPDGGAFGTSMELSFILMLSGPLTAVPLILFSYAARRAFMATIGLVQYLNPTLQFICAVVIFKEPFGPVHALAFGLIWLALAIYSVAAWRQEKARRKSAIASSTDEQVVT